MPEFMRSVAPQTLHFTPWGLGGAISPEAWMEIARAEMDAMPLPPEVPPEVGGPWAKLQRLYCSGLFDYEAFTHVERDAHRVLEIALKMCFLEHYQRRIPVTADGRLEVRDVRSFDDVFALLGSGSRKAGHRLQGHPRFDASLNSLMVWAREERYFYGQHNRVREEVTVEIRNHLVHSEFDFVEAPPEALRTLSSLYQMILRLWGYNTPGYDLYPGPIRRSPWLLGVGVNELRYVWLPLAGMSGVPPSERHDLMWYVLLASETERLSEWTPALQPRPLRSAPCGDRDPGSRWRPQSLHMNPPGATTRSRCLIASSMSASEEGSSSTRGRPISWLACRMRPRIAGTPFAPTILMERSTMWLVW
jgi:hypothetical protein